MPFQRGIRLIAAAVFALAALGSFPPAKAEEKPAIDMRAARIFKAALENVAAAKSFSFDAEIEKEAPLDSGQNVQYLGVLKTHVRRPDHLATSYRGEDRTNAMYYDGKVFTLSNPLENVYATWEAPPTLQTLFEKMREKIGFVPPLSALLHEDAGVAAIRDKLVSGAYLGRAEVRGVDCHHLIFGSPDVDLQVWITVGEPVLKRVVVTYKKAPGAPQYTATFLAWDFDARPSDYLFTFDPPPEARRIQFQVGGKP